MIAGRECHSGWSGRIGKTNCVPVRSPRIGTSLITLEYDNLPLFYPYGAFARLDEAARSRVYSVILANIDPVWDDLRLDPRFDDLLVKLGLPPGGGDRP